MLRRSWFISLAISLVGVMLVEHFFTLKADETAAIGSNLGIYGISLVAPFILLSLFITCRFFIHYARTTDDLIMRTIITIFMFAFIIVVGYFSLDYRTEVYESLGGTRKDTNSLIYGYPFFNEYTNRIFINMYTYFFSHAIAAFIGLIIGTLKPIRETQ